MPWKSRDAMSLRREFVELASAQEANMRELCRRYGISPPTGYKWLKRWEQEGLGGLGEQSRRPRSHPGTTPLEVEQAVVAARREHPAWGGRKLRRLLLNRGSEEVPAASTITGILRRHGLLEEAGEEPRGPFKRFERRRPNEMWQMDFKGHFGLGDGNRCHPLGILDDCSRFNIGLEACGDERGSTVQSHLREAFQRYGLPQRILCDNGPPWGDAHKSYTKLGVWLLEVGVEVSHGRAYHPQTQGKEERFHRSLKAEVLRRRTLWRDLSHCSKAFARWREVYNHEPPHEALGMACPVERYRGSSRRYEARRAPVESYYLSDDELRKVKSKGEITFKNVFFYVGRAFSGKRVALRPCGPGQWDIYFCWKRLGRVDLKNLKGKLKGRYESMGR
jgi:transposase InsO family protein